MREIIFSPFVYFKEVINNARMSSNNKLSWSREIDKIPYEINEENLKKNAKEYGERVALEWYGKMIAKLGNIRDVDVSEPNRSGYIVINGKINGHDVHIEQQRIFNVSKKGLLFHQFPARIYIDGKATSEADYKRATQTRAGNNKTRSRKITGRARQMPTEIKGIR